MLTGNERLEADVQRQISDCIDDFSSFRLNAGAGAGKTYALIETIKYILKNKLFDLQNNNQQVICITYTNVAVNEINERLGLSDIVLVSTIHERLWELFKLYEKELIILHKEKIKEVVQSITTELSDLEDTKYKKFANLTDKDQSKFIDFILENKEIFYRHSSASAPEFRAAFNSIADDKPSFLKDMLKNVSHFRDVVKRIYKKENLQGCLYRIENGKETKIKYDSKSNSDRLEYMRFSHDTLLEYGSKLIENYPVLRRIIIDKYPYVFIDEYQDTNENVIKIIKNIYDFSSVNSKPWLVGYFGDTAQNIYDDGVGSCIELLHPEVTKINKQFNRRSHSQIIDVINVIRNDTVQQKPIFTERNLGSVEFYYSACVNEEEKHTKTLNFLSSYQDDLSNRESGISDQIHCLILTNKLMAQLNGFSDIYDSVNEADSIYWKDLNTKLLSHNTEKLHPTIFLLYKLIMLYRNIQDPRSTYFDIFGGISGEISFASVISMLSVLKEMKAEKLGEFIFGLSEVLNDDSFNMRLKRSLLNMLSIKSQDSEAVGSLENFYINELRELMNKNIVREEESNDVDLIKVNTLLNVGIVQWGRWADFINGNQNDDVIYHTYHGTKGEEYENVAIVMGHDFGKTHQGKGKFKSFFEHVQLKENEQDEKLNTNDDYKVKFENTKNLIYVACSRAVKNLRILYLDDIGDISNGIKSVFGSINEWDVSEDLQGN